MDPLSILLLLRPRERLRSIVMSICLSVCLSVREDISRTTRAIFAKFLCMLPLSVAGSSFSTFTIGRIACRREGVFFSIENALSAGKRGCECTARAKYAIYDCLVSDRCYLRHCRHTIRVMCLIKSVQIACRSVQTEPAPRPARCSHAIRAADIRLHRATAGQSPTLESTCPTDQRTLCSEVHSTSCNAPPTTRTSAVRATGRLVMIPSTSDLSVSKTFAV